MKDWLGNTLLWMKGLVAATIGGGASAVTAMFVDQQSFNLDLGLPNLLKLAGVQAVIAAAMYLKKSPVPEKK